ncbi:NADH dehydrogenase [ubiquinone] 1 alpha subcomplex subunit 8-like [Spodoptera frugiperda]|uniref:NADH dehydrogenase [ubiquinone] 1 alpha subcomplex subunit 8-like n=1 Tax=Spodoptera frugiperda TaxID=7108 RepID=A0A9R0EW46_SPOFR|nr:NADH dehydrogenase [ubiquinone] 1 alpha subcomplex subunit 8-like [Spodoptera frugiperda]
MVVTEDVTLPDFEDLETDEVKLSTGVLLTASAFIGKQCEGVNNEFVLCRQEYNDPRACLEVGKQVTACAKEVLKRIRKECCQEFNQYANCVDKSSRNYTFRHCRRTQAVFDNCMRSRLCLLRNDFGYFCRGRIHKSTSDPPEPPPCPCHPKVDDATPSLPDCKPRKPARFGGRLYWSGD